MGKKRTELIKKKYHSDLEYREKMLKNRKEWGKKNRDKINAYYREYRKQNPPNSEARKKEQENKKKYYQKNKKRLNEYHKNYQKQRRVNDPEYAEKVRKYNRERYHRLISSSSSSLPQDQ